MERAGQLIAANIRSNDLAFRYDTTSIAILLGETGGERGDAGDREAAKNYCGGPFCGEGWGPQRAAAQFSAGVAEAVIRAEYDPIDVVTEIINRVEYALSQAVVQGPGKVVALEPAALAAGAVA